MSKATKKYWRVAEVKQNPEFHSFIEFSRYLSTADQNKWLTFANLDVTLITLLLDMKHQNSTLYLHKYEKVKSKRTIYLIFS